MSEPSCRTKKRPLDLAAVRQKQLQKRRRETSGSGSTAVDEHVQRARGENTSLPGKPPLVTKPSETSFDTYVGGLKNNGASPFELKPETAPEEPEFKLFGKGVLKAPPTAIKRTTSEFPATFLATSDSNFGRTRSTFSVHSGPALPRSHSDICPPSNFNPFSAEATAREEGCVKRRNPFSIFGSKSTADSSERTDGPGLAEIGEHVMTALQAVRRDVPSLSKIHSLPGLISPNVRTSKRSRSDFFAAAHFKDHSDEELSEDEVEAQMSDMEEEDTWWLNEHDEVEADDYQDVRSAKEGDESQSDSPGDEPESPTESKKFGFLDLLAGKILGRSDITEAEIATVTDVAGNSSPPDVPMAHSQSRSEKEPEDLPGSRSAPRTRRCYKIQPSTCFPVDWSLKTHVTLISKTPFKCADQPSSVEEVQHLAEFATKTPPLTEAKTIYPHLYHYIYPPAKPAPAHVALMAKVLTKEADGSPLKEHEGIELEYFKRGVEQWKKAFRSLYLSLRANLTGYFYYINSEFSVLLLGENQGWNFQSAGSQEVRAILSPSSSGLRKRLNEEDVKYEVLNHEQRRPVSAAEQAELGEVTSEQSGRGNTVNAVAAALMFTGHSDVHGLFNFLLDWKDLRIELRAAGLPTLISKDPFKGAALQSANITRNERVKYNLQSANSGQSTTESMHKLEIDGYILPCALRSLLAAVRSDYGCHHDAIDASPAPKGTSTKCFFMTGMFKNHPSTGGIGSNGGRRLATDDCSQNENKENQDKTARRINPGVGVMNSIACKGVFVQWK